MGFLGKQHVTAHTEQDSNHSDVDKRTENTPGFQSFFETSLFSSKTDRKDIGPS